MSEGPIKFYEPETLQKFYSSFGHEIDSSMLENFSRNELIHAYPRNICIPHGDVVGSKITRPASMHHFPMLKLYDNQGERKDRGYFYPKIDDAGNMMVVLFVHGDTTRYDQKELSMPQFKKVLLQRSLPRDWGSLASPDLRDEEVHEIDTPPLLGYDPSIIHPGALV